MIIKVDNKTCVVFDLDDTIYYEEDYLKSAFRDIASEFFPGRSKSVLKEMFKIREDNGNVFKFLIEKYPESELSLKKLLSQYRNHFPDISPKKGVIELFHNIKKNEGLIGLITDGRSFTQRNKINALGIFKDFNDMIISEEFGSEKPSLENYRYFMLKYPGFNFIYIGDNPNKDFISPKKLGWYCIGMMNPEKSIYKYRISDFAEEYLPHAFLYSFEDIIIK